MCNLSGTHGNSCILYTIEQPVLQTFFVTVYNMSVYEIFAATHNNNQMEHAHMPFHGSFVKNI